MKNGLLVLVVVLVLVAGAWAAANFGFVQTKVQTHTIRGNVRQVVSRSATSTSSRGPAGPSMRRRPPAT